MKNIKNALSAAIIGVSTVVFVTGCNFQNRQETDSSSIDSLSIRNLEAREDSLEMVEALKEQSEIKNVLFANYETDPVDSFEGDDAADDPAIWVNVANPSESLVLGTNKKGGVYVYNLQGKQLQYRPVGLVNNIDLRDGFQLNGEEVVLVAGSNRSKNTVTIMTIDKTSAKLSDSLVNIHSELDEVYGLCCYRDMATGSFYIFVNGKGGVVEQWNISGEEQISATLVRSFSVNSQPEGMVADDATGTLYLGVEEEGIYVVDARPDAGNEMKFVPGSDTTNSAISYDIEGLAIFELNNKKYLLASSQGNFSYAIFDVTSEPTYITSFIIAEGDIDGAEETDGLEITTAALPGIFEEGLLVVQDGFNTAGEESLNQNFKYVAFSQLRSLLEKAVISR